MANILICVPSTREYKPFLDSFDNFLGKIKEKHTVITFIEKNKKLKDVQNEAAQKFLAGNFDYLLFMDDDHWGHTPEMLECLINSNAYMSTIKSYSRHRPYFSCLMNKIEGSTLYSGIEDERGYIECDLTGFPMTLIRRDLLQRMSHPYFEEQVHGGRDWGTDISFCNKLISMGIRPVGCFQHTLPHADITEETVLQKRQDGNVRWEGIIMQMSKNNLTKGELVCTAHP